MGLVVRTYEFTLILEDSAVFDDDALLDYADRLFEHFGGDVNPATAAGVPVIDCTLAASSLEAAIQRVAKVLNDEELTIRRIEIEPDGVLAA